MENKLIIMRDEAPTELREEEKDHNDGGNEGDDTTRESTAVEIFINFGISV